MVQNINNRSETKIVSIEKPHVPANAVTSPVGLGIGLGIGVLSNNMAIGVGVGVALAAGLEYAARVANRP